MALPQARNVMCCQRTAPHDHGKRWSEDTAGESFPAVSGWHWKERIWISYQILWYTHVMNKPISVKAHLSIDAIETRYRKAKDGVERSHWHIIWLLAQGKTTKEIALVTGYCPTWIRTLAHRYDDAGPQGLGDRRHANAGGTFLLSHEQQAQLQQALDEPPTYGGLWTGPKVAQWILAHTGRKVPPQRGWEYLKRLNYSKRVLRPRHAKADQPPRRRSKKPPRAAERAPANLSPGNG
jgi:transposase